MAADFSHYVWLPRWAPFVGIDPIKHSTIMGQTTPLEHEIRINHETGQIEYGLDVPPSLMMAVTAFLESLG